MKARITISPISAEPIISARICAASNGSAVQPSAAGPAASERLAPRELAYLAGDLADMMRGDGRLAVEAVAPHHIDRALEHEPSRRVLLADVEHDLARREIARGPAGEIAWRSRSARRRAREKFDAAGFQLCS